MLSHFFDKKTGRCLKRPALEVEIIRDD